MSAVHGPGSARIAGDAGLLVDRSRPVSFRFEGKAVGGFEGDTIASALVADGRWLMVFHQGTLAARDDEGTL